MAREGRAGRGGAPGARGRDGPSLPARCSRRRSEAALSPQRDLFSSFLLNSSSRERLVVTGRAGWMGMGRGAGPSALGFWPTFAFLLCSFPAGKAQPPARGQPAGRAGPAPRVSSQRRATGRRVGAQVRRPPASHFHASLFLPRPAEGAMDAAVGTWGNPSQAIMKKRQAGRSQAPGTSPNFREKGGTGMRPLGAPEKGENGRHGLGAGGTFSSSSPSSLQTCRVPRGGAGGAPEVPGLTRTAPSRGTPSLPPALAHAGKPTDWASKGPYSCLITFRVAPCLFLLCQKGREFQN